MSDYREQKVCSMPNCTKAPRAGQRYCPVCHSKYMRAWRAKRKRSEEKLKEDVIRLRKKVVELEQSNRELRASVN
jgi:hypothetical protein